MLIARTPLRIPLGGGLTDLKAYAERFGGTTISSTIGQAAHVTLLPSLDGRFEVVAEGRVETAENLADLRHDLVREALRSVDPAHPPVRLGGVGRRGGAERPGDLRRGDGDAAACAAGLPRRGARRRRLGAEAAHIEVEVLQGASGYHDPNVCARGGLLRLDYDGPRVTAREVRMAPAARAAFEGSLLLFSSGRQARTKPSLDLLSSHLEEALPVLHDLKALANELEARWRPATWRARPGASGRSSASRSGCRATSSTTTCAT
jgi:D-glycero-alpha-D-manno-heptose-7-phosphate kinase